MFCLSSMLCMMMTLPRSHIFEQRQYPLIEKNLSLLWLLFLFTLKSRLELSRQSQLFRRMMGISQAGSISLQPLPIKLIRELWSSTTLHLQMRLHRMILILFVSNLLRRLLQILGKCQYQSILIQVDCVALPDHQF
jgi:hypothetical protein